MFHKWKLWQEDAALDSSLERFYKRRREKFIEIVHLKWKEEELHRLWSQTACALLKAQMELKEIDFDKAFIDGRFAVYQTPKPKKESKAAKKATDIFKNMTEEERRDLIAELEKL